MGDCFLCSDEWKEHLKRNKEELDRQHSSFKRARTSKSSKYLEESRPREETEYDIESLPLEWVSLEEEEEEEGRCDGESENPLNPDKGGGPEHQHERAGSRY
jgi:hypothetical protein